LFIEVIDSLRCPREHNETWLVAAFNRMSGRFVVEGTLGCPECNASYPIENGIADLRIDRYFTARVDVPRTPPDPELVMRTAAYLNLVNQAGTVIVTGGYNNAAPGIAEMTGYRTIAIDPWPWLDDTEIVSSILADARLPFATSSIDGIALHDEKFMHDVARVLKPGARLIAPSASDLPQGLRELDRDESLVVAEAIGPLLTLRR
jgi:uncharacterized protein YbaR (Trm112 family)